MVGGPLGCRKPVGVLFYKHRRGKFDLQRWQKLQNSVWVKMRCILHWHNDQPPSSVLTGKPANWVAQHCTAYLQMEDDLTKSLIRVAWEPLVSLFLMSVSDRDWSWTVGKDTISKRREYPGNREQLNCEETPWLQQPITTIPAYQYPQLRKMKMQLWVVEPFAVFYLCICFCKKQFHVSMSKVEQAEAELG